MLLALLLLALPGLAGWAGQPDWITLGTQAVIFGLAAASLDLLIGITGLMSFGHAAFFGLGGYVVAVLAVNAAADVAPGATAAWIAFPAAMAISGLAALVIGALSLRTAGLQFIMITLAFAEMLYFLFVSLKFWGGDDGLGFRRRSAILALNMRDDTNFYYVCVALLAAFLALAWVMLRARFGMALQGIRQSTRRMQAVGIAPYFHQLVCFVIAGAGAGLAGALQANLLRYVSPDMLHWTTSGELMVMVVLGGASSLFGPVLGAALFVVVQSVLARWTEHWMVVFGPLLVLVVLFAPRGVWGWISRRQA